MTITRRICVTLVLVGALSISASPVPEPRILMTSAERIADYGYPVETYTVQTSDAYILTLFRIPYSPNLDNEADHRKPIAFLQHGLLSSSDSWLLNGPDNALAYQFADAGYDVWMGNARGNVYSRKHATKSPLLPPFWDFTWNEIGLYDLPAMIDYVLYRTGQDALHYVGHSQGTTAFMVMLSSLPFYNDKIKTSHMLAPVVYMEHMESPFAKVAAPLLGRPSILSGLIGSNEFMPNNQFLSMLGAEVCRDKSIFQPICGNVLFLIAGWDSEHLNYTLLPEVMETHPAGASSSQLIHYLQEYVSGYFRKYDFGYFKNKRLYSSKYPTNYFIYNIRPEVPINFYYADNDYFAAVVDVERLAEQMGDNVVMHHIKYKDWNHLDFLWALEVREVINDPVIAAADAYENAQLK